MAKRKKLTPKSGPQPDGSWIMRDSTVEDHDKLRPDAAEIAFRVMQEATGQAPNTPPPGERPKNTEAVERGRAGGKKGGIARAESLSARKRKSIAKKASAKRWNPPKA